MMPLFFAVLIVLFALELVYFRVATKFKIVDKPNSRSSHEKPTIRGGGIIFPIAFVISFFYASFPGWPYMLSGLLLISFLSFIDDLINLDSKTRLIVQGIAVLLLLAADGFKGSFFLQVAIFILITGIINAYNFMDGINGITAFYSLVFLGSMFWVDHFMIDLLPDIFFIAGLAALLVFSFFNARKIARCFAGDVGSVSMSFIICFILISVIRLTGSINWILLLGVYGIDAIFTIICRIFRRESILKAHRSHFYQFLANDYKISHIAISIMYAFAQILLNCMVIYAAKADLFCLPWACLFVLFLIYVIFRFRLEGRKRLFIAY